MTRFFKQIKLNTIEEELVKQQTLNILKDSTNVLHFWNVSSKLMINCKKAKGFEDLLIYQVCLAGRAWGD